MKLPLRVQDWPARWREALEERCAIMRFDGRMSSVRAEREAEASTRTEAARS